MEQTTLILYGTRGGATKKSAETIARILGDDYGHQLELLDVNEYRKVKKRVSAFRNIIIGSSVRSGQWVGKALRILRSLKDTDQKILVFVTAGGTMNLVSKSGISKDEAVARAVERYIDRYRDKYGLNLMARTAFGGWVKRKEVVRYDNWNAEDVEKWTRSMAELL